VKQVTQSRRDGTVTVRDVPVPVLRPGWVLVESYLASSVATLALVESLQTGGPVELRPADSAADGRGAV
jgi:hypothetical protein